MVFAVAGGGQLDTGGYQIDNSLRFNEADQPRLSRTPGSTSGDQTFTLSFWVKRNAVDDSRDIVLFEARPAAGTYFILSFRRNNVGDKDRFYVEANTTTNLIFAPRFRDDSAWYHMVVAIDTTQGTSTNRVKFYVNGSQITDLGGSTTYPALNESFQWNKNVIQSIASSFDPSNLGSDYQLAEVHNISGQQLEPTDFGEFDSDSGIWKPIKYTGSYGTNGFYLDFENSGSLGADQSGNGNNFTPTNLASTDQMIDTPTNNFATLNALDKDGHTNAEGNLEVSGNVVYGMQRGTTGVSSGKWYFEARLNQFQNDTAIALANEIENVYTRFTGETTNSVGYLADGRFFYNGSSTSYSSLAQGDIFQMAFDADTGKIWIGKNNTWQNSGNPASGTGQVQTVSWNFFLPAGRTVNNPNGNGKLLFNFGQDSTFAGNETRQNNSDGNGFGDFYYTPPSGFLALCTQNLATELTLNVDKSTDYFNTLLWTGNGSTTQTITGVGFNPDFVWIKNRTNSRDHNAYDTNRGDSRKLKPNINESESNVGGDFTFEPDGYFLGNRTETNENGSQIVGWNWKANDGSTSTNTNGSITSTVQVNQTAGFSIVTYTGTGGNATVGHGLGVAPSMIITKKRSSGSQWAVYTKALGPTGSLFLDTSGNFYVNSIYWNNTNPTSTVWTMNGQDEGNASGQTYVAYCFAEIEGYSKFGTYIGNGNSDGPFTYTGFKPAFLLVKKTNGNTAEWMGFDNKRNTYNVISRQLRTSLSAPEDTGGQFYDFLSNGFKNRNTALDKNSNGNKFFFMAFAENPFVTSTGIAGTAR
jgi:hypothetical protein